MKIARTKIVSFVAATGLMAGCGTMGQSFNSDMLMQAGVQAATALTISDDQVVTMSKEYIAQLDAQSKIAPANDASAIRLAKIVKKHATVDGMALNYKVYKSAEVNAFACADGSIRVYEGLMKIMTDEEILAIIGHEIGHVVNNDVRNGMRTAYLSAAARAALSASNTAVGVLSQSMFGDMAVQLAQSQFSQKQEYAADDYSLDFLKRNGYNVYAMSNALGKLVSLEAQGGQNAGLVANLFSTHPDSAKRATRSKEKAASMGK